MNLREDDPNLCKRAGCGHYERDHVLAEDGNFACTMVNETTGLLSGPVTCQCGSFLE